MLLTVSPELDDGVTLPVASSLRKIVAEIEGDIAKLEKDRDAKLEAAKADYGPDRAYFAIKDKCIEKKIEVCVASGWMIIYVVSPLSRRLSSRSTRTSSVPSTRSSRATRGSGGGRPGEPTSRESPTTAR